MEDSLKIIALAKKLGGSGGGSGGGTTDYEELDNLPSVNGVELRGNTTAEQLGLMSEESAEDLENAKQVTYAELKTLRDNSQLVPGMLYRITDYVTTINGTIDLREVYAYDSYITDESRPPKWFHYARSAGHQFDLVVIAVGENELDGSARACHHEGDTYFANSNLGAWQLKYMIDNDTTNYSYADPNGKGIITWMRDEFNNECFYDFKNVQYLCYALEMEDSSTAKDSLCYDPTNNKVMRYCTSASVFFAIDDWMYDGGESEFVSPIANHKLVAQDIITTCIDYPTVDATYLETFNAAWYYTFTKLTLDQIDDFSLNDSNIRTSWHELCRDNFITLLTSDLVSWWDGYIDDHETFGLPVSVFFSFQRNLDNTYFNQLRTNRINQEMFGVIIGDGAYDNIFTSITNSVIYSTNVTWENRVSAISDLVVDDAFYQNTIDRIDNVIVKDLSKNYFPGGFLWNSFFYILKDCTALSDVNIWDGNFKCVVSGCLFRSGMTNVEVVGLNGNDHWHGMYGCVFNGCSYVIFTINNRRMFNLCYETVGVLHGASNNDKLNVTLSSNGNAFRDYTICLGMDSNGQLKEWIPAEGLSASDVPSKTSDLTNDSGFLTLATLPIWDGGVSG